MAVGNFNPDPVKQRKLNQKAKEVWIDGPRGEKIMIVNSKGEFVEPDRLGGEKYSAYQNRIREAMLKSGLYPRLNRAAGVQDRHNQNQYKKTINQLKIVNNKFNRIEASKGTGNEYAMSLAIPNLTKQKEKLEARRLELETKSIGTKWDVFNDPTSPSYKGGGEEVGTMVDGVWQPKGTSTTNQPPVSNQPPVITESTVSNDGQEQGNTAVTGSTESEVTSKTATTPITTNDPEPHLGSWRRGSGESLKGANARTEKWLVSKGVDINQIAKHNRGEVYRNLRIGGPHIVNGMLQLNTGGRGANSRFSLKINQS